LLAFDRRMSLIGDLGGTRPELAIYVVLGALAVLAWASH
jgi:hypothetical protein